MTPTVPAPDPARQTMVKASCPQCREVVIAASDVIMWIFAGDFAAGEVAEPVSHYEFRCPSCFCRRVEPVTQFVFTRLRHLVAAYEIPAEAVESHSGPAIGHDDALDFMLAEARTDFLSELALG